jgi:hypothetical protein
LQFACNRAAVPTFSLQILGLAAQFARQGFKVAHQLRIIRAQGLNAAHRMQNRGVITPTKPPANIGQGAGG